MGTLKKYCCRCCRKEMTKFQRGLLVALLVIIFSLLILLRKVGQANFRRQREMEKLAKMAERESVRPAPIAASKVIWNRIHTAGNTTNEEWEDSGSGSLDSSFS